ncbi:MAG: hypothetical protein EA370_02980 [Wenzhouxiangella sp.]|nr:MAG: hypothetical protein EA370_02980 [Wenzhouxiangella sp.]
MKNLPIATLLLALTLPVQADWDDDPWGDEPSALSIHGFVEAAAGYRLQSNPVINDDWTLGEARLQLEGIYQGDQAEWRIKLEGIGDGVADEPRVELREARVSFPLGERADVRIGRQILTWGTGDLVFLNDLFPKDWVSFLIGRDDEYLKGTSDAIRLSWFGDRVNLDTVITPRFNADTYITGERLSYFDPGRNQIAAAPPRLRGERPSTRVSNAELALRLYGMTGASEWAVYGYRGFFGQPTAFDTASGNYTFARLNALGASLRGPLAGGLYNIETAWYDSADDRSGDDPFTPNSEFRFLVGFDREMTSNFSVGAQYYLERLQNFSDLEANWPFDPAVRPDQNRHLLTMRLSWRLMRDNLVISAMNFYSPSSRDYFIRPTVQYRFDDRLQLNAGIHLFGGRHEHSFYGQFEENSSAWTRLRYHF